MERPPQPNEFEISVFGPGFGECILIHLYNNNWIIVDSCIDNETNEIAVLKYLKEININPEYCVRAIIITHWHDDHIRGIHKLVEICSNAKIFFPSSLNSREFATILAHYSESELFSNFTAGTDELYKILEIIDSRKSYPNYLSENTLISLPEIDNFNIEIIALSPSNKANHISIREFSRKIQNILSSKNRISSFSQNYTAIALQITINHVSILLGSDLENTSDPDTGWVRVINNSARERKSSIFKIPHHGSASSHNEDVWNKLLEENPISFLTPFTLGRNQLPTISDIRRICKKTDRAYSTCNPNWVKKVHRDRTVEKTIKEVTRNFKTITQNTGQISLRFNINNEFNPTLRFSDNAIALSELNK